MSKQLPIGGCEFEVGIVHIEKWMATIGRTGRTTASRWIRQGLIKCEDINGQHYITKEESDRFIERAKRGEFAMEDRGIIEQQKRFNGSKPSSGAA